MAKTTKRKSLVIVESPAKAKTINRYLGSDFEVTSSMGHIRDLPSNAREIPAAVSNEPWARLGVNVEDDFKPVYVIPASKQSQVTKLKKLLKGADTLYLACDEDREIELPDHGFRDGEHLRQVSDGCHVAVAQGRKRDEAEIDQRDRVRAGI